MITAQHLANRLVDGGELMFTSGTYSSSTAFTFLGADYSSLILKGTKVEINNGGTVKYGYVTSVTYSSGTNTVNVTVLNDVSGTITSVANSTITNIYFSNSPRLRSHPIWLNFTPSYTNLTLGNGTTASKFAVQGKIAYVEDFVTFGSTSSMGTAPYYDMPISSAGTLSRFGLQIATMTDSSAGIIIHGATVIGYELSRITLQYHSVVGSAVSRSTITPTAPFTWATGDSIRSFAYYEI